MGYSVSLNNFGQVYTTRKAARTLTEYLFNNLDKDTLIYMIKDSKNLKDYVPADKLPIIQSKIKEYKWFIDTVTVDSLIEELPKEAMVFFNSVSGGMQWLKTQLTWLKGLSLNK